MKSVQIDLVQQSWKKILPDRAAFAKKYYERLIEIEPSHRQLFKKDMRIQENHFLMAMGMAIAGLKEFGEIAPNLRQLGERHVDYGVKSANFVDFVAAFFDTLNIYLGTELTEDVRQAWTDAFNIIITAMHVPE